jgi:hypothetical protein
MAVGKAGLSDLSVGSMAALWGRMGDSLAGLRASEKVALWVASWAASSVVGLAVARVVEMADLWVVL